MVPQAQKTTLCTSISQRNAKKKKEFNFKGKKPHLPKDKDPQTA